MKIPTYLLSLSLATAAWADTQSLKDALAEALHTENVTRDREAAAAQYARIIESYRAENGPAEERPHAAAALFRFAEIRRLQDREDEAGKHYRAYLSTFPDLEPQAGLARRRIGRIDLGGKLTQIDEDPWLTEDVGRVRWNLSSEVQPDEFLLTTFAVKLVDEYGDANEGLPPGYEIKTLHHAPSGLVTQCLSRTFIKWPQEYLGEFMRKHPRSNESPFDRWNQITGFGHSYVIPEGLFCTGGGSTDRSLHFNFGDSIEDDVRTKWLQVELRAVPVSRKRAWEILHFRKMKLPKMGDEAWSLTLPPVPGELPVLAESYGTALWDQYGNPNATAKTQSTSLKQRSERKENPKPESEGRSR